MARDSFSGTPNNTINNTNITSANTSKINSSGATSGSTSSGGDVVVDKATRNPLLNVDNSMHSSLGSSLHMELEEHYFCSELVANALQSVGALPMQLQPSSVWPGGFASGQMVDEWMEPGASFGNIYICVENYSFLNPLIILFISNIFAAWYLFR